MMPGFGGGMGSFGWMVMSLGWLVFLAIVGTLVWLVVRTTAAGKSSDGAREILAQRYARGEIDDQEYQQRLRTLGS